MSPRDFAELGVATFYEAGGRVGLVDGPLIRVIPGSRVAGPARTVLCGQGDNLGVHHALDVIQPGEVLVAVMPSPAPVALVGELLAVQAKARGAVALLVDAAVRDYDELVALGQPIWARFVSATGAAKSDLGQLDVPVQVGGVRVATGDIVIADGDGVCVVRQAERSRALADARARAEAEAEIRTALAGGASTLDLLNLREVRS